MQVSHVISLSAAVFTANFLKPCHPHDEVDENPLADELRETPCPTRKPLNGLYAEFILNTTTWYIPLASQHFYASWGEMLLNRTLSLDELKNSCFKYASTSPTKPNGLYFGIIGGFKKAITQLCQRTGFLTQTCRPKVSQVPYYLSIKETVDVLVETDNRNWFLMVRCVDRSKKDWALYTTSPSILTSDLNNHILHDVSQKFNFDYEKGLALNYELCEK